MVFQAYEYGDQLIALYREVAKQSVGEAVKCKMLLTRMLMGLCALGFMWRAGTRKQIDRLKSHLKADM